MIGRVFGMAASSYAREILRADRLSEERHLVKHVWFVHRAADRQYDCIVAQGTRGGARVERIQQAMK